MFDCEVEERWRLTEESEHTWCLSCMMNDREVHARSYACSLLSLSAIRTPLSRSHSPSISLSFSVDLSHGDIYLLLFVFSFLSTHTTCSWCLRVFALCLKRWRQGRRWGFEGLTEESEHTRWFLSMSAMLGAVRAHSLSVSHSSGPSLSSFRCYMFEPLKFLWHRSISCSIINIEAKYYLHVDLYVVYIFFLISRWWSDSHVGFICLFVSNFFAGAGQWLQRKECKR